MSDNKFKSAAARLLALHSPKGSGEPAPQTENATVESPPESPPESAPEKAPVKPVIIWKKKDSSLQSAEQSVLPIIEFADTGEASSASSFAGRRLLIVLPALLGAVIATVIMSPTIIGIGGNLVLGLLGGAAIGVIIAKEL